MRKASHNALAAFYGRGKRALISDPTERELARHARRNERRMREAERREALSPPATHNTYGCERVPYGATQPERYRIDPVTSVLTRC